MWCPLEKCLRNAALGDTDFKNSSIFWKVLVYFDEITWIYL